MRELLRLTLVALVVLTHWQLSQCQTAGTSSNNKSKAQESKKKPQAGDEIDPDDVIRIETNMVSSPVLVIGRDGKFVPDLKKEDFQILENGLPQQIASFTTVEKPFTVALLIDTSRSTISDLQDIQSAAVSFVDRLRPGDRALVISFSNEIRVLAEPTTDPAVLKAAIRSCRPEGSSRVYDAIAYTLNEKLNHIDGRLAIVLFSDGVDNDSQSNNYQNSLHLIQRARALIYPVQFNTYRAARSSSSAPPGSGFNKDDYARADAYLHQVASFSGTGVYTAQNIFDLNKAVASIVDELHNEYSIGYYPGTPLKPHEVRQLTIRTRQPQLVVRARTSYSLDPDGTLLRLSDGAVISVAASDSLNSIPISSNSDNGNSLGVDSHWICKGVSAPMDYVVVKEGFSAECPKSRGSNDEVNAWFVRRPGETETACKGFLRWQGKEVAGAPIPSGYVVTSEVSSPVCSRSTDTKNTANAWTIKQPSTNETVCKGFLLPRGYVTVTEVSAAGCPAKIRGKNAWIIRRVH